MIRPPRLRPGDTIGIISPSSGLAASIPHRIERGARRLEALGFRVTFAPHALEEEGFVSAPAADRVADLHALFLDSEVKATIATLGGDHSCHLLPLIDFDLIRRHPKILMGFSDTTVLATAITQQTGLVTFDGPMLMTDIADFPDMPDYSRAAMLKTLCDPSPIGALTPSDWWTDEFLDWRLKLDLTRPRAQLPGPTWTWLKGGYGEGPLVGGCLESLQHLRGTQFWPDWSGAIFFFETSEEKPSPEQVDAILMDYENMGVLAQIRGLLIGRPTAYSDAERAELRTVILDRTKQFDFPIVTDLDFGHTSPILTLPRGCRTRIDATNQTLEILDSAVT